MSTKRMLDKAIKKLSSADASYPAEVYKMLNEVSRIRKIDKNYIDIRSLGGDKYEYSDRLGDTIAVYNNKNGKLQMYK